MIQEKFGTNMSAMFSMKVRKKKKTESDRVVLTLKRSLPKIMVVVCYIYLLATVIEI